MAASINKAIKRAARIAVQIEVEAGRITRPLYCASCGEQTKVQAHHNDYLQPLVIEWLCGPCHRSLHRGMYPARMDTLQSRLAAARRAAGLTQAGAAAALQVHEKSVARWESRASGHGPSLSALRKMAQIYNVNVSSLIEE